MATTLSQREFFEEHMRMYKLTTKFKKVGRLWSNVSHSSFFTTQKDGDPFQGSLGG